MKKWNYRTPGIPDDQFVRGDPPMSKEEVRSIVISKLRLKDDQIVYDIGAGTGSISIEIANQVKDGRVFAVEKKSEGVELVNKNADSFNLDNIKVIEGRAPGALHNLPNPDRVFIGGSGGSLQGILKFVDQNLKNKGRIVITAITINTLNSAINFLEDLRYKLEICNIAITRTKNIAGYHMFDAQNPIYIITGFKEE